LYIKAKEGKFSEGAALVISPALLGNPLKSLESSGLNFHSWSKYLRFGGSSSFFAGPFLDRGSSSSSKRSSTVKVI